MDMVGAVDQLRRRPSRTSHTATAPSSAGQAAVAEAEPANAAIVQDRNGNPTPNHGVGAFRDAGRQVMQINQAARAFGGNMAADTWRKRMKQRAADYVGWAWATLKDKAPLIFMAVLISLLLSELTGRILGIQAMTIWAVLAVFSEQKFLAGAFARDIPRAFMSMMERLEHEHRFFKRGFHNRVNISLNTFIPFTKGQPDSYELRTLDELSLADVLPDKGAQNMMSQAKRWTDKLEKQHGDPFVTLSEVHAAEDGSTPESAEKLKEAEETPEYKKKQQVD